MKALAPRLIQFLLPASVRTKHVAAAFCGGCLTLLAACDTALAQVGKAAAATGESMPWQVAALFTANWVLVAVGVAMMSRPTKRSEKPKKTVEEEAA